MANAESLVNTEGSEEQSETKQSDTKQADTKQSDTIRTAHDDAKADGATKPEGTLPKGSPTTVQHAEPEDAYLTGGQRNLQRRVLGLNVEAGHTQRPPEQSPGLHSTGSFTGVANGESKPE